MRNDSGQVSLIKGKLSFARATELVLSARGILQVGRRLFFILTRKS